MFSHIISIICFENILFIWKAEPHTHTYTHTCMYTHTHILERGKEDICWLFPECMQPTGLSQTKDRSPELLSSSATWVVVTQRTWPIIYSLPSLAESFLENMEQQGPKVSTLTLEVLIPSNNFPLCATMPCICEFVFFHLFLLQIA